MSIGFCFRSTVYTSNLVTIDELENKIPVRGFKDNNKFIQKIIKMVPNGMSCVNHVEKSQGGYLPDVIL